MKILLYSFTITSIFLLSLSCRCDERSSDDYEYNYYELAEKIRNNNVRWLHSKIGIHPIINGKEVGIFWTSKNQLAIKPLFKCLKNKNQYIVAHVLLSRLLSKKVPIGKMEWNELKFKYDSSQKLVVDDNKSYDIILKKWNNYILSKPSL